MIDIIYIIAGITIVLLGANWLTDGATRVARSFHMPEFVIGLTIVAFGTSMPELCVSMASALQGTSDMAVGNVVGSNIFNMFMIIGVCALLHPMAVTTAAIRRDLPFAFVSTLMLLYMLLDGELSKGNGLVMVAVFAAYMVYMFKSAERTDEDIEPEPVRSRLMTILRHPAVYIIIGLASLVGGSEIFVSHAVSLAHTMGVSEAVIGITILGAGTSLPEFATSVVAALKGRTSMAMGNVVGSCVFNILLILGLTAVVTPLTPSGISTIDLAMLFAGSLLLWFFSFTKSTMERWEGAVLTIAFVAYMAYLLV